MTRERDDPEGPHHSDAERDALTETVEDARRIAAERRESGWEALVVPAVDTAPVPADADEGYSGFVHVVPDNYAEQVTAACGRGNFPRYDVYRRQVGDAVCFVTELLDPETETALLVAGSYRLTDADALYRQASREGVVRTHLRRFDGELLGSFEHERVEKFFPDGMESLSGRR